VSTMVDEKGQRRVRRSFTDDFKAGAVRPVLDEGKTVMQVARDLDLTTSALRQWVERARADRSKGQDRAHQRGARGAGAAAQGGPRAADAARHSKKSRGLLRERDHVKFAYVDVEKAQVPVTVLCRTLEVSRTGFYAWRGRPESTRAQEDRRLAVLVRAAHEAGRRTYGSPRVLRELRAQEIHIGCKRIMRLMRAEGLEARVRRRYRCTTMSEHDQPIAPNLLGRNFQPATRNQSWASDTTEFVTGSGKLYLAAVLDLYSRFLVGWAVSAVNDRHLVIKALDMALRRRCRARDSCTTPIRAAPTPARTTSACSMGTASPAA